MDDKQEQQWEKLCCSVFRLKQNGMAALGITEKEGKKDRQTDMDDKQEQQWEKLCCSVFRLKQNGMAALG